MRRNMNEIKKTINTAKIIVIAEELKRNNKDISIYAIKEIAKQKNIEMEMNYATITKTLKEKGYEFVKVFDKNKFSQRRIEMAQLTRLGWTLQMIADKYGITRQGVSLLLKKAALDDNQVVVKSRTVKSNLVEKNVVFVKRSKKESCICQTCGKQFFSKNKKRKNCSKVCLKKSIEKRTGGEWSRIEKVDLVCSFCSKPFQRSKYLHKIVTRSKGNSDKNYCSRECYHSKNRTVPVQGVLVS